MDEKQKEQEKIVSSNIRLKALFTALLKEIRAFSYDNLLSPTNSDQKTKERMNNFQGSVNTIEKRDFQKNNLGPRDTPIENEDENARTSTISKTR